jgi:hypothetical protein
MARYRLCYDGRWQESFEDEARALAFGRELAEETGHLVHVVRRGLILPKLLAVFPESRVEEGEWLWKIRAPGVGGVGS